MPAPKATPRPVGLLGHNRRGRPAPGEAGSRARHPRRGLEGGRPLRSLLVVAAACAFSLLVVVLPGCGHAGAAVAAPGSQVLASKQRCAANKAAGTITYLTGFGYEASVGILDPIAAQANGFYHALCLHVVFKPGNGDPAPSGQLVAAGRATFTELGSPSDAITDAAGRIPVDAVATYGNTTIYTLLTMPSITNLRQLDGKTLGYKGAMPPILTAMLEKAGVDMASLKEVNVGYDPTILPRGQVQALTAYKSNEPIELRDDGYKVREWDPESFGLHGAFNVLDVNEAWAQAHPGTVEDFLRANFEAYHFCLSHATKCVEQAAKYQADYPVHQNVQRWQTESSAVDAHLIAGHGVGYEDQAQWRNEYQLLLKDKLIKAPVDLSSIINARYVDAIYRGATLQWPGR